MADMEQDLTGVGAQFDSTPPGEPAYDQEMDVADFDGQDGAASDAAATCLRDLLAVNESLTEIVKPMLRPRPEDLGEDEWSMEAMDQTLETEILAVSQAKL